MQTRARGQDDDAERVLMTTEAARFLGIDPKTLRKWSDEGIVRAGRLPGRGDRRYTMAELRRVRHEVMGLPEEEGRSR